jgi:hypothetical protein
MSTKKIKIWKNNKKALGKYLYYFFHVPLTLLYTITSSWCGRFDTPCIGAANYFLHPGGRYPWLGPADST